MQKPDGVEYRTEQPEVFLSSFIKCFWSAQHFSSQEKKYTVLPDGYFDILFRTAGNQPFTASIIGLWTKELEYAVPPNEICFAISFKLLSVEYIFKSSISSLLDKAQSLPNDFWNMEQHDFTNFNCFVRKVTQKIKELLTKDIDSRKQELFDLLYASGGSLKVEEISDSVHWSCRQINEYFTSKFGISLKQYCNILRFRASFDQLKKGHLYPEQDYFDQAHFIKEVKRFSGVTPKNLAKNKNDRFIQFSTLPNT